MPYTEDIQGQAGPGSENPNGAVDVPVRCRGVCPFQVKQFYNSVIALPALRAVVSEMMCNN